MPSQPNWGFLLEKGRCKAIGVPWTEAELHAVYKLKIPVDYVRNGCLTSEEFEREKVSVEDTEKQTGQKPLIYLSKVELIRLADKLGIEFVPDDVERFELIHLITVAQKKDVAESATTEAGAMAGSAS